MLQIVIIAFIFFQSNKSDFLLYLKLIILLSYDIVQIMALKHFPC